MVFGAKENCRNQTWVAYEEEEYTTEVKFFCIHLEFSVSQQSLLISTTASMQLKATQHNSGNLLDTRNIQYLMQLVSLCSHTLILAGGHP